MSTLTMPRIRRTQPKHRAIDRVDYLEHQVAGLEDLAGRQAAQLDELGNTHLALRELFDQAGIDLSGALEDVRAANERATEAERLRDAEHAELVALRARVANLDPFHVPVIGQRDIDPDDESTYPIDVSDLRAKYADDYINQTRQAWQPIPLHQSPQAVAPTADDSETTLTMRFPVAGRRVTADGAAFAKATA